MLHCTVVITLGDLVSFLRKPIRAMPFFRSSILPSSNAVNSVRARVAALVGLIIDRFDGRIKDRVHPFVSCSDLRLKSESQRAYKVVFL